MMPDRGPLTEPSECILTPLVTYLVEEVSLLVLPAWEQCLWRYCSKEWS